MTMENLDKKPFEHEIVSEPKPSVDSEGNLIFKTGPDEMDPDYVRPEESSGIPDSASGRMSEEEFADFVEPKESK